MVSEYIWFISAMLSGVISLSVSYCTARYMVSIEHKKQEIPYAVRLRDECSNVYEILNSDDLRKIISEQDTETATEKKTSFINAVHDILAKNFVSYRPFLNKELVRKIEHNSTVFLNLVNRVGKLNMESATEGRLPTESEINDEFGVSASDIQNKLVDEAHSAIKNVLNDIDEWLDRKP